MKIMKYLVLVLLLVGCSPDRSEAKRLYMTNCATCHGPEGKGDGPSAIAFTPPPRNYTAPASEWKNAKSIEGVTKTLTEGVMPNMWAYSGPKEHIPLLAEYVIYLGTK